MLVPRMLVSTTMTGSTSIESVTAYTSRAMSCMDSWQVTVSWVIQNPNNALYSLTLRLEQPSVTVLLTNQDCASGTYMYETNLYGDTSTPYNSTNVEFQLRLIQRSDSAVIQSVNSDVVNVQWTACPP